MNRRALLKGVLVVVILVGLGWWWWQSTTPDLPVGPTASASPPAKRAIASINLKIPPITKTVIAALTAKADDTITPTEPEPSEAEVRTAKARAFLEGVLANTEKLSGLNQPWSPNNIAAILQNTNYALEHQDPSLPYSAYLTVPLDQADHHVFNLINGSTLEASIEGDHYNDQGMEWVQLYVWQRTPPRGGTGLMGLWAPRTTANLGPSESIWIFTGFSPTDQDYIRNWAKQQAAAAANTPAAPPVSSELEPPAPYVPPAASGLVVITN